MCGASQKCWRRQRISLDFVPGLCYRNAMLKIAPATARGTLYTLRKQSDDSIHRHGYGPDEIEITDAMVAAAVRAMRDSGVLEYPGLVDESLMRRVLWVALASR